MPEQVKAIKLDGSAEHLELYQVPDTCPLCHHALYPRTHGAVYSYPHAQVMFQCTRADCQALFVGYYHKSRTSSSYVLSHTRPSSPPQTDFGDLIEELSPSFVEIYNQAIAAESTGLTQLVGCGLRKALEFLVKDFAIRNHPDDEE